MFAWYLNFLLTFTHENSENRVLTERRKKKEERDGKLSFFLSISVGLQLSALSKVYQKIWQVHLLHHYNVLLCGSN